MTPDVAPPLLLVAASGLARETAVAARAAGLVVAGCLDDDAGLWGTVAAGLPVLGGIDTVGAHPDAALTVCAGRGGSRAAIVARLDALGVARSRYTSVVDPSARVPDGSVVGVGSILLAGVVLTADVSLGAHVVCMPHVVLTHDCHVEDFATLCAGVVLGGSVLVGRGAYVGMSASVRERLTLGPDCVVGMGSVVLGDVPAGETWAGNPARRLVH